MWITARLGRVAGLALTQPQVAPDCLRGCSLSKVPTEPTYLSIETGLVGCNLTASRSRRRLVHTNVLPLGGRLTGITLGYLSILRLAGGARFAPYLRKSRAMG